MFLGIVNSWTWFSSTSMTWPRYWRYQRNRCRIGSCRWSVTQEMWHWNAEMDFHPHSPAANIDTAEEACNFAYCFSRIRIKDLQAKWRFMGSSTRLTILLSLSRPVGSVRSAQLRSGPENIRTNAPNHCPTLRQVCCKNQNCGLWARH